MPFSSDSDEDFSSDLSIDTLNKYTIYKESHTSIMNGLNVVYIVGSVIVLLLLLGCCCRRKKYRGQVIAVPGSVPPVPPAPNTYPQQPYPTQQYPVPVVTAYPTQNTSYPAPYPVVAPYPNAAPYPSAAPYPTPAPYPTTAPYNAGPYPTQGAPYPTQDASFAQPSAPESHALPPSYEQAVGGAGKVHP